ncbi:GWxTD domain-containing protein [Acidobacteriota bacterium]
MEKIRENAFSKLSLRFICLCISLIFICNSSISLAFQDSSQAEDKKVEPLSKWSQQWLEEVVPYIITSDEKKYFLSLPTEIERGQFMLRFWKVRDTDPNTPENEFKLEHYRRIAMANNWFGAEGIAGWRTARGKTLILLGPPHEVETSANPSPFGKRSKSDKPLEGMMDVSGYHGGMEVWGYYGVSKKVSYLIDFIFVDRFGSGNYVLAKTVSGGNPYRRGIETNIEAIGKLTMDTLHDFFDDLTDQAVALENPFEREDLLKGIVTTQVSYEYMPLKSEITHLRGSLDKTHSTISIEIPYSALANTCIDGKYNFSLSAILNIRNDKNQIVFEGSKDIKFDQTEIDYKRLKDLSHTINIPLALKPTLYTISLVVFDNYSGNVGVWEKEIRLPSFAGDKLMLGYIFLSSPKEETGVKDKTILDMNLIDVKRDYHQGEEMKVSFKVYNPSVNSETGLCSLKVEYSFFCEGKLLAKIPAPMQAPKDQRAFQLSTTFKLKKFKPGKFVLRVNVIDINSGNSAREESEFFVIQ